MGSTARDTHQLERLLSAQQSIGRMLVGATDLRASAAGVLETVCDVLECDVGEFWENRPDDNGLKRISSWHRGPQYAAFDAACASELSAGQGLPGGVCHERRPFWSNELAREPRFLRRDIARRFGLSTAYCLPTGVAAPANGAMLFLARGVGEPSTRLLSFLESIATQAGQLLEHLASDRELQHSFDRLSIAQEAAHMGSWEWNLEADEVTWSSSLETLHGLAPGEFAGTFEASVRDIHPEDRAAVLRALEESVRRRQQLAKVYRIKRQDGAIRWLETVGRLLLGNRDEPRRLIGVSKDITERVQRQRFISHASRTLATSLEYEETVRCVLQLAVPHVADWGVLDIRDEEGRLHRWEITPPTPSNGASVAPWGETWSTVDGRSVGAEVLLSGIAKLVPSLADPPLQRWLGRAPAEVMGKLESGNAVVAPIRAPSGVLGVLTLARGMPRATFDEEELELVEVLGHWAGVAVENARSYGRAQTEANARRDFLAVVSHDLRNPLSGIALAAQVLSRGAPAPAQLREIGTAIEQASRRMARLLDDLLLAARIETQTLAVEPAPCSLATIIDELTTAMRPRFVEAGKRLQLDCAHAEDVLPMDAGRIKQVLENLLNNALEHTPAGGSVTVGTRDVAHGVRVRVRDAGPGIPKEAVNSLFRPYWRASGAEKGGAGLGLTIAKNLVEAHGGHLWVESQQGEGTEVTFFLPGTSERSVRATGARRT